MCIPWFGKLTPFPSFFPQTVTAKMFKLELPHASILSQRTSNRKPETPSRDEFFDTVASTGFYLYRHADGEIRVNTNSSGIFTGLGKYRDPNAFYHVVFQGTGTGLRLYVNGDT